MHLIYTGITDFGPASFYLYRRIKENVAVAEISLFFFNILTASWVSELTKFNSEQPLFP